MAGALLHLQRLASHIPAAVSERVLPPIASVQRAAPPPGLGWTIAIPTGGTLELRGDVLRPGQGWRQDGGTDAADGVAGLGAVCHQGVVVLAGRGDERNDGGAGPGGVDVLLQKKKKKTATQT